jgi:hypothetical protein
MSGAARAFIAKTSQAFYSFIIHTARAVGVERTVIGERRIRKNKSEIDASAALKDLDECGCLAQRAAWA